MIAIITDPQVGGTFLTWTLYYLSGQSEYYHMRTESVAKITDSPLTTKNAHNFLPNQLNNTLDVDLFFNKLIAQDEYVYMHQFETGTKTAVDLLCSTAQKTIVVSNPPTYALYYCGYNLRGDHVPSKSGPKRRITDADDMYQDLVDYFFKDSKEYWEKENLNNIWDKREFIALNFDPYHNDSILNYVDKSSVYYHLHTLDLWTTFDLSVRELFDYVGLKIDQTRFDHWICVYHQWRANHYQRLRFAWYFDTIIDYVIRGVDFDLEKFNLDVCQEAAIQRALMYKHNINLKTWQLIKFTNTKQLYQLLEPNIHDLSKNINSRLTS